MGRNLFIRVSAVTYDEKAVPKAWPTLYAAVWPDPGMAGAGSPARLARNLVPASERGVLELVDAFVEYIHFGDLPKEKRDTLKEAAAMLEKLRGQMGEALGNRDVPTASGLTNAIEDALDQTERLMKDMAN